MKHPFDRGFKWTLLSKATATPSRASLDHDTTSNLEDVQKTDKGPITTAGTYDSLDLRSEAQKLSPKCVEDNIADTLQVDGWRFGASAAAITAGVTALINLSVAVWLTACSGPGGDTGDSRVLAQIFKGSCDRAATMNTWSHLAINVVSTGLLAGSNYCSEFNEPAFPGT